MAPDENRTVEIRELINAFLDDRLDEAGHVRVKELIVADADVRRAYVEMMSMLGGVHCYLQQQPSIISESEETHKAAQQVSLDSAFPLLPDKMPQPVPGVSTSWFCLSAPTCGLLFVALLACGISLWLVNSRPTEKTTANILPAAIEMPLDVRLDTGTARLLLPNVGYMLVEGPADLRILSSMRARLSRGRIKMRVTEETGKGYIIETPDGEVKDLGTEFGLNVTEDGNTGLIVFEGSVDLRVADATVSAPNRAQRFVGGEGVVFSKEGRLDRLVSVITGSHIPYNLPSDTSEIPTQQVIANVSDNIHAAETNKFYEIVPAGLREDALAYGDRSHEWNGLTSDGMPAYLVGADYVKTFNSDNARAQQEIYLTLAKPAKIFLFLDVRAAVPDWLKRDFRDTGDRIGLDASATLPNREILKGAGQSIDEQMSIWERVVSDPGTIMLGSNPATINGNIPLPPAMYGIAAVALNEANSSSPAQKR